MAGIFKMFQSAVRGKDCLKEVGKLFKELRKLRSDKVRWNDEEGRRGSYKRSHAFPMGPSHGGQHWQVIMRS